MTVQEKLKEQYQIDILADKAGGYFTIPSENDLEYTDLLFDVCKQFGIRYYSATPKEQAFVEEVTRVTWALRHVGTIGINGTVKPAFTS